MSQHTVLLLDDEVKILHSIQRLLLEEDYDIVTATSPREALEVLKGTSISLVISDYRMPEMDGVTFLQKVKGLHPDVPRIILSGYLNIDVITDCINKGEVYKFIIKPWNDEDLKITIRKALEHFDLITENRRLYETITQQNRRLKAFNEELERRVEDRTRELSLRNQALMLSQEILENLSIAIVGISDEGFVVFVNKKAEMIFNGHGRNLMAYHIQDLFPGELLGIIHEASQKEEPIHLEDFTYSGLRLRLNCLPLSGSLRAKGVILEAVEMEG